MQTQPVVLISGGSRGIGKAAAEIFATKGSVVYEVSRSGKDAAGITHITGDVTDPESMRAAVAQVMAAEGRLNVLVTNAGYGVAGPLEYTSPADMRNQFEVNVFGTVHLIQAALPALRASGGGRIILTSSMAAITSIPFQALYSASKAAVNQIALALNNELKPFNITCTAVMPGDIATDFPDNRETEIPTDTPYGEVPQKSVAKMESDERNGTDPRLLAGRIVELALAKRTPKPLIGYGAGYRSLLGLVKFAPARFVNYCIYQLYCRF
ncbi:MAG: SDR family oxidoreductase [Trueperella sp.]|nr:SDR family oxidoreductase [Trueperella sp.]